MQNAFINTRKFSIKLFFVRAETGYQFTKNILKTYLKILRKNNL